MADTTSNEVGFAIPERCSRRRSDDRRCGRPTTRVRVTRTDNGLHIADLRGFCEPHGSDRAMRAIPVEQFCKGVGRKPIRPGDAQANVLAVLNGFSWDRLRGGAGVGRTVASLTRRGLVEFYCSNGRRYYRLTQEGVHAHALLHVRHVYYGPGSHVFNTPWMARPAVAS